MKTSEFKKILKPLIRQTVKEVILEEGLLSGIVAEVAKGLQGNLITEKKNEIYSSSLRKEEEYEREKQKRIRKLNESNKFGNVFEGTQEIQEQSNGPLSGIGSQDKGVDISAIEKIANGKWKRLM
tara:strand:- start:312 stop:686 length:375 start_codon:yes stop_codon:yes gene_type:complete